MTDKNLTKNDLVTVDIADIGADGEGIGKVDGLPLFIKDAVIGDRVEARVTKTKKHYGYARVERVIEPSPFRVQPACGFHRQCGGCQIQAFDYEKQLEFKQNKVRNHLIRIGGFGEHVVEQIMEPILGMEDPWHYRNKAQYPVGHVKGVLSAGFYAERTHSIIPVRDCLLTPEVYARILDGTLAFLRDYGISAYDEGTGEGL